MRRTTLLLFPLLPALFTGGCDDTTGPTAVTSSAEDLDVFIPELAANVAEAVGDPEGDRPAGGDDADYGEEAFIFWTRVIAGFTQTAAWAQASMEFYANYATINLGMDLRYNGKSIGARSASAGFSEWIPLRSRLDTSAAMGITGQCGHIIDAWGTFAVWFYIPDFTWGKREKTDPAVAAQPTCVPDPPPPVKVTKEIKGGSGEGEDSDWYVCYYTYYYDSVTGRLLRTEFHGCQPL
jgi:hypothetical protein